MADGRKVNIYFAASFKDLQEKALATQLALQKGSAKTTLAHADCLWHQAEKKHKEGDEELVYFFLYRCREAVICGKNKKDFRSATRGYEHLLSDKDLQMRLEDLQHRLEKRYAARDQDEAAGITVGNYEDETECYEQEQLRWKPEDSQRNVEQTSEVKVTTFPEDLKRLLVEKKPDAEKQVGVKVCEIRVLKLPLKLYKWVQPADSVGSVEDGESSMKITVLDLNPKPAISTAKSVELCEEIKKKLNIDEIGGGPDLYIYINVVSFNEGTKVVQMNIVVDGPLVDLLVSDYQRIRMTLDMRLYGKKRDLEVKDTVLKRNNSGSGTAASFVAKVGLVSQEEWLGDAASDPKAKVTINLVGEVM
ncbi:hypothetical protein Ocin01_11746 [Orchesella cincta]|uniref:USP8 dimerisation domain-containing protein n=1 Tax=Orchesella cincta TaxID=48709 RepID=A0A1D2MPL3_ORCCI|nr:hypothetical protein Ocin01_11746 [Orchesella cincta]